MPIPYPTIQNAHQYNRSIKHTKWYFLLNVVPALSMTHSVMRYVGQNQLFQKKVEFSSNVNNTNLSHGALALVLHWNVFN